MKMLLEMGGDDPIMLYDDDPIDYALELVAEDRLDYETLCLCCLKAMSNDEVKLMLDNHELSPRFFEDEEDL